MVAADACHVKADSITAAAATAAVSTLRIVRVRRTAMLPAASNTSDSSGLHPPSGPTRTVSSDGNAAEHFENRYGILLQR